MVKIFMGKIFAYSIEKISQNSGYSVDKNFCICYPEEIYDELIETIADEKKICHYLIFNTACQ